MKDAGLHLPDRTTAKKCLSDHFWPATTPEQDVSSVDELQFTWSQTSRSFVTKRLSKGAGGGVEMIR